MGEEGARGEGGSAESGAGAGIERGELTDPEPLGAEEAGHLADDRPAAAMADEMQGQLNQRSAAESWNETGIEQGVDRRLRDLCG